MPRQIGRRLAAVLFAAAGAGALAGIMPASAGEIATAAGQAESMLAAGSGAEAFAAIDRAYAAVWRQMPLSFRAALLVDSAGGYGDYLPRAAGPFSPGDTVTAYLEPVGYGWILAGDGYRIALTADVEIRSPDGIIYAKADDFAAVEQTRQSRNREFSLTLALVLPQLRPGDYELRVTIRDAASPKSATAVLPIAIAGDGPADPPDAD